MSGSTCFFYASGQCVIFSNTEPSVYRPDSTRIQPGDVWIDVNNGMLRTYKVLTPPGFTGWQPMGVMGDSSGDPVNFDQNVAFDLVDLQAVATAYPHLCFKSLDPTLTTTDPKYTIVMNNGNLYFRLGSVTGPNVMTLTSTGNVQMTGDLTVVGDLFADDVSYDVNQCNILKVADEIVHVGNESNKIAFLTDKMTIDASGTSIVLDDTAMTNNVVVTGSTQFVNNIDDVPDIYLRNHIHHYADANTRIGFPANDTITLRTNGTDRTQINASHVSLGGDVSVPTTSMYVHPTGNVSIKTDSQGAPGFPQDGLMIEQLSNIGWHNYANNGTYANMFRAPNSAALILANGWRRSATPGQFASSVTGSWGRAALSIDGNYGMTFYQNDASDTAIGTDMTPNVQMVFQNASLGIGGITSPEASIHVNKAVSGGEGPYIFLDNSAGSALGNKTGIRFATNLGATFAGYGSAIEGVNVNAGNGAESLTFSTWDGANRDERVRIHSSGAVSIGQQAESYKFCVNSSTSSGNTRFISDTNAGCDVAWITGSGAASNTKASLLASPSPLGNGYGQLAIRTRVNDTFPTAFLIDGSANCSFGSDAFIGGQAAIVRTNTHGSINVFGVNGAQKIFAGVTPPSPYTGTVRIVITWVGWGGNNTGAMIKLDANGRIYSGNFGYVTGFVTATQSVGGTAFTTFSTAGLTQSNITCTASSPGNYQLQLDLDPNNNCDRMNIEMTIPEGGTGSPVSAVQITIV